MSRLALLQLSRAPHGMWRIWAGGACPVDPWTGVTVLLRDGSTRRGLAGEYGWAHDAAPDGWEPDDIVAYRVPVLARLTLCGQSAA